jgi:hypothetical protein
VIRAKWIPLKQASTKYFYATQTLVTWVKKKHINGVKQAGKWYIEVNSLKRYLNHKESI